MKKIYFMLLTILFAATVMAQNSANYTFTITSDGSLAGTTQFLVADADYAASVAGSFF